MVASFTPRNPDGKDNDDEGKDEVEVEDEGYVIDPAVIDRLYAVRSAENASLFPGDSLWESLGSEREDRFV